MSNPKRKELCLTHKLDSDKFCYTSLDDLIAYLTELRANTNGEAQLDLEVHETYYNDYRIEAKLIHRRMETDEEYTKRCKDHHKRAAAARKAAKTRKVKQEREEREMLKKLQEKYKD